MTRAFLIPLLMIVNVSCLSQKKLIFDDITDKLSKDYYVSSDHQVHTFIKVENDIVFADFILWNKFPRRLISDTLYYNGSTHGYQGNFTFIRSINGKPYICTKQDEVQFFGDIIQHLTNDDAVYYNNIKEKNYALWYELSREYQEKTGKSSLTCFFEVGKRRNIKTKLDNYSFDDFTKEVEVCKKLLFN